MMPLKQGKILPPCPRQAKNLKMFFLLDSAGPAAWLILDAVVVRRRAQRMNFWCPTGLEMRYYILRPTIFDLPVPDGRQLWMCRVFYFMRPPIL